MILMTGKKNPPGKTGGLLYYIFITYKNPGFRGYFSLLYAHGVRNSEPVTATGTTCRDHLPPWLWTHAGAKSVLIYSFPSGWLKCPFHRCITC